MKLRALLGLFAVTLLALAIAMPIAADTEETPPPKKVWVCHFNHNHTAPEAWTGGGALLDGDYVLNYVEGGPTQGQIDYCLDHGGVDVITVALPGAENGHKAQLLERAAGYP